ncbi:MAG: hypothetical protein AAF658_05570 [Myxococcota bacterium]
MTPRVALFALVLLAPLTAQARSLAGAGLSYGADINQAGLNVGYLVELPDTSLRVGGIGTVFFPSDERDETGFDISTTLVTADLVVQWRLLDRDPVYLYLTGGLHLDFARASFTFDDPNRSAPADNEWGLGVLAGGGADFDLGFSGLFIEAAMVGTSGAFSQLLVHSGLRIWFN